MNEQIKIFVQVTYFYTLLILTFRKMPKLTKYKIILMYKLKIIKFCYDLI